ncbi:DUF3347 domain-containing protein [Flavobacteriaceae bacterium TP-CH-4]|uniref:DUF3347 domain-containing protein n=2 Tax=Pelagihabitans pacificus TaxID=2696054 RepID=A0A967E8B5_9FLAO|nr:DUF3347 domain-containing protein [Pelagihabitans pacificus]
MLVVTAAVIMTLSSCGENKNKQDAKIGTQQEIEQAKNQMADIADASFSDEMTGKVFHNYQQVRTALVNSDSEEVRTAAGNLAESFSEEREDMKATAMAMAEATDIEKQRELFSGFTEKVEPMLKESISEGTIYKQFCPMAFDGKGGYWISNVDEIRNPYYGEKMLKCGKVVATIEK